MLPFRPRFFAQRIANPSYYRKLARVVSQPTVFFTVLVRKILPGLSTSPSTLRLTDGKILRLREFWSIFLFDEIFMENCYEAPEVLQWGPVGTIVDIGANIGLFTLRSKQLWPHARVIAIEPHPGNFAHLVEHIEINRLANVQPLNIGVADKCGCIDLYLSPRNIGGHSMYTNKEGASSISVPVSTLADTLAENHSDDPGLLLKIDCEGCEYAILSNLTREMATRISCIIFEPTESLYDVHALLEHLESLGFQTSRFGHLCVASRTNPTFPSRPPSSGPA
jgi:FkbM family methyltransferase